LAKLKVENMKIISKNKDFYDFMNTYGIDEKIIYFRKTKQIRSEIESFVIRNKYFGNWIHETRTPNKKYTIEFYVLGLNNKFYPGIRISEIGNFENNHFYWNDTAYKKIEDIFTNQKYGRYCTLRPYKNFFDYYKNLNDSYFFKKYDTPLFIIYDYHYFSSLKNHGIYIIDLNPILIDYEIHKFFDGQFIYNEIYEWLSLNNIQDTVEISDENKIIQHGFDKKISFRNTKPSEKKTRRKLNKQKKKSKK
jgi:hypothetical protein